jgi:class 3 adenylate cyclase
LDIASRPTGTVTFLFTDIEGRTHLWEQHPDAMRLAVAAISPTVGYADGYGAVPFRRGEGR